MNLESLFLSLIYTCEKHFKYLYIDKSSSCLYLKRASFNLDSFYEIIISKEEGKLFIKLGSYSDTNPLNNKYEVTSINYVEVIGKLRTYIEDSNKYIKMVDLFEEDSYE